MSFFRFIPTMTTGVIQTFGKFSRLATPGLTVVIPFMQKINIVSNRLSQNQCKITVRTSDKVFPNLDVSIQYKIKPEHSNIAFFEMENPEQQMISYVDNTVREVASHLTLDQLFESQTHIAEAVLDKVGPKMVEGGYTIESVQIRNIDPPTEVLKSMNEINASERRKIAAKNEGEASKIKAVLLAEADAQEKALRGTGIAKMRENITEGWAFSVLEMSEKTKTSPQNILNFMIKVLQQETLESMSKQANTKVIFVDKNADNTSMGPSESEMKESMMAAMEAVREDKPTNHL